MSDLDLTADFYFSKDNKECNIKITAESANLFKTQAGAQILLDVLSDIIMQHYSLTPDELNISSLAGMH
jgi:hypothetical protein